MDSPDLSGIDKTSFLQGLQLNDGNPLHSTAVEEDLNDVEEKEMDRKRTERKDIPKTLKATNKQRGAAVKKKKKKDTEEGEEEEEEKKKKKINRRSTGEKIKTRPGKNQQMMKDKKRKSESGNGKTSDSQSQEESDSGTVQQNRRRVLSSDEEIDEDTSWNPSPKKARMYSLGRSRKSSLGRSKPRKSSSGSASGGTETASSDKQKRTRHQGGTDLDVVLDAFLDFCDQYSETVESKAVKKAIHCFSDNVKDQLVEKISSCKELRILKRENAKVGSSIRTKTQKLLNAKHELMRAERQLWLLQKEKAELKLRLADLRRGQAFLHDIGELNRQYLDHRRKHPNEKETYGASSLPALLLETKFIHGTETRQRGVNERPEKRQKQNVTDK
ncbi:centromere protein U [Stegastes partitus]|uniref:Centromere protein U n=1 Tax=Stegastes partitus TaxID=144197 RepID=A0A3B5AG63_9TELE|nr:PREDICTED: centromere protein U [Stegastes partitus]XP_008301736.1 PREDICTED: centromere protein U [Stegastes partitus]XP_008301737.1 PREDICTED: centromere protein U [Stegastes partitus]